MMILIGSLAITMQNMANDGPKAMNVQPKNSASVIFEKKTKTNSTFLILILVNGNKVHTSNGKFIHQHNNECTLH